MKYYISLLTSLLILEVAHISGHAISRSEINPTDVYQLRENQTANGITVITPKARKPTLREIVYYHLIEKPYGEDATGDNDEQSQAAGDVKGGNDKKMQAGGDLNRDDEKLQEDANVTDDNEQLHASDNEKDIDEQSHAGGDITRDDDEPPRLEFTNSHGYQFLDEEEKENAVDTSEGTESIDPTTPEDRVEGEITTDSPHTVADTEFYQDIDDKGESQKEEALTKERRKRGIDYSETAESLAQEDIASKKFDDPATEQLDGFGNLTARDERSNMEHDEGRTYGMSLTGNSGLVWNDLNKGSAYAVGESLNGIEYPQPTISSKPNLDNEVEDQHNYKGNENEKDHSKPPGIVGHPRIEGNEVDEVQNYKDDEIEEEDSKPPSIEDEINNGRTYGMSLTENTGRVWNDLNKISYNVGGSNEKIETKPDNNVDNIEVSDNKIYEDTSKMPPNDNTGLPSNEIEDTSKIPPNYDTELPSHLTEDTLMIPPSDDTELPNILTADTSMIPPSDDTELLNNLTEDNSMIPPSDDTELPNILTEDTSMIPPSDDTELPNILTSDTSMIPPSDDTELPNNLTEDNSMIPSSDDTELPNILTEDTSMIPPRDDTELPNILTEDTSMIPPSDDTELPNNLTEDNSMIPPSDDTELSNNLTEDNSMIPPSDDIELPNRLTEDNSMIPPSDDTELPNNLTEDTSMIPPSDNTELPTNEMEDTSNIPSSDDTELPSNEIEDTSKIPANDDAELPSNEIEDTSKIPAKDDVELPSNEIEDTSKIPANDDAELPSNLTEDTSKTPASDDTELPSNETQETIDEPLTQLPSFEEQIKNENTYGMIITGDSGTVWNDLNGQSVSYHIGEGTTDIEKNIPEITEITPKPIDNNGDKFTTDEDQKPGEISGIGDNISSELDEVLKEIDSLSNDKGYGSDKPETTTKTDRISIEIDEALREIDNIFNNIGKETVKPETTTRKPNKDAVNDIVDKIEEMIKNETAQIENSSNFNNINENSDEDEDSSTNERPLIENTLQNVDKEIVKDIVDIIKEAITNETAETKNNSNCSNSKENPKGPKINEMSNESDKTNAQDNDGNSSEKDDKSSQPPQMIELLMKNEQFWKWLHYSSTAYLDILMTRVDAFIKEEVAKQVKEYFTAHNNYEYGNEPEPSNNIEGTIFSENLSNNSKTCENSTGNRAEEKLITKKRKDKDSDHKNDKNDEAVKISAQNVYGNSVGNDKVTNIFIFNIRNQSDVDNIKQLNNGTNGVFVFGSEDKKGDENLSNHDSQNKPQENYEQDKISGENDKTTDSFTTITEYSNDQSTGAINDKVTENVNENAESTTQKSEKHTSNDGSSSNETADNSVPAAIESDDQPTETSNVIDKPAEDTTAAIENDSTDKNNDEENEPTTKGSNDQPTETTEISENSPSEDTSNINESIPTLENTEPESMTTEPESTTNSHTMESQKPDDVENADEISRTRKTEKTMQSKEAKPMVKKMKIVKRRINLSN